MLFRSQTDEEDAWYDHQLVGLAVVRDGVQIGTLTRLEHLPAQDLLIVKTANGEVMIPFVKAIVPSVDVAAGIITITPPPGLLEELPDEPDADEPDTDEPDTDESAPEPETSEPAATPTPDGQGA